MQAKHPASLVQVGPLAPGYRSTRSPYVFLTEAKAHGLAKPAGVWLETSQDAKHQAKLIKKAFGKPSLTLNVRLSTAAPSTLEQASKAWPGGTLMVNAPTHPLTVLQLDSLNHLK